MLSVAQLPPSCARRPRVIFWYSGAPGYVLLDRKKARFVGYNIRKLCRTVSMRLNSHRRLSHCSTVYAVAASSDVPLRASMWTCNPEKFTLYTRKCVCRWWGAWSCYGTHKSIADHSILDATLVVLHYSRRLRVQAVILMHTGVEWRKPEDKYCGGTADPEVNKPARIVLSEIRKSLPTNQEYSYLKVPKHME